jgi:hypothetical protein
MVEFFILGLPLIVISLFLGIFFTVRSRLRKKESPAVGVPFAQGYSMFLSDSRDAAFEYIETVQSAITELKLATESKEQEKIDAAYNNLINLLPE